MCDLHTLDRVGSMTVEHVKPDVKPNPRYASGCRACGTTFKFDQADAEVSYSFPNHTLTLACPGCGMKLAWTIPPVPLREAT